MENDAYGMKGSNQIKMNQATVASAMQLWVDTFMVGYHVVKSVKPDNDNYNDGLVITLESEINDPT